MCVSSVVFSWIHRDMRMCHIILLETRLQIVPHAASELDSWQHALNLKSVVHERHEVDRCAGLHVVHAIDSPSGGGLGVTGGISTGAGARTIGMTESSARV
jgi:hypothetical protein